MCDGRLRLRRTLRALFPSLSKSLSRSGLDRCPQIPDNIFFFVGQTSSRVRRPKPSHGDILVRCRAIDYFRSDLAGVDLARSETARGRSSAFLSNLGRRIVDLFLLRILENP